MKNIFSKISIALVALSVAACDLNLYPIGSLAYSEGDVIITSASDLSGFEANIMYSMRALEYGDFDIVPDVMMDYFNYASDSGNNYGAVHRTDGTYSTSDSDISSLWASCYAAIKNFNVFIEGVDNIDSEVYATLEDDINIALGEAYFGRAYAYIYLARHWGPAYNDENLNKLCVPLVTVYDQNARPARATVEQVYQQIKNDLDYALIYLVDVDGEARAERPTIDAVNALRARYFIDVQDYQSAYNAAVSVISTNNYTISNSANLMKNEWILDSAREPILQYYASTSEGTGYHSVYYSINKNTDAYYTNEYFIPTSELIDSYDSSDLRLTYWYGTNHPSYSYSVCSMHVGTYYNESSSNPDYLVFSKYKGNPNLTIGSYPGSAQAKKPLLISEMYLIAAEAAYKLGESASALKYLNAVQSARHSGSSTYNTEATWANIKKEWYKETVGEGLRMSCLKRWGEGYDERPYQEGAYDAIFTGESYDLKQFSADDYHFLFPIPSYEIQVNPNLEQSDGWDQEN